MIEPHQGGAQGVSGLLVKRGRLTRVFTTHRRYDLVATSDDKLFGASFTHVELGDLGFLWFSWLPVLSFCSLGGRGDVNCLRGVEICLPYLLCPLRFQLTHGARIKELVDQAAHLGRILDRVLERFAVTSSSLKRVASVLVRDYFKSGAVIYHFREDSRIR